MTEFEQLRAKWKGERECARIHALEIEKLNEAVEAYRDERDWLDDRLKERDLEIVRQRDALETIASADLKATSNTRGIKGATMTTALEMRTIARRALSECPECHGDGTYSGCNLCGRGSR